MTSYFSSITSISNLSTRFTSLRRAISADETDDPENEDLSHISNVLRAYYNEKGRRLPPWLPPDKKSAYNAPVVATSQASFQGYGGTPTQPGGRGGLGDLWDDSGRSQPPQQATGSLRSGRGQNNLTSQKNALPPSLKPAPNHLPHRPAAGLRIQSNGYDHDPSPHAGGRSQTTGGARPLPSQRAGSYQTSGAQSSRPEGMDRTLSGASAQDRLRARLHGGSSKSSFGSSKSFDSTSALSDGGGYSRHQAPGQSGGYR
ncbi:hypothetical protein MGYG_00288 [Nannizzia gypsea CBS 118893]|uniref:Mso1 N-terminal domain-containing protein n=1 Tax=Arthroderma gypseum (strain ATCC MYA-4604 / CBS 118893) TaxID=535722 RepID=E5QYQ8_ARTGP|nr:hypothetical protein MGYG_00288 [Nannizzia gypsea CBS 118893]EFQ97246.1 hypothetical protein MGYG_00288 [Nannizzia gypsea CBS 118893]